MVIHAMVNYPNGKKAISTPVQHNTYTARSKEKIGAGGRGMELEKEINITKKYYLSTDRAVIHKKPTPVTIVHVDYPKRSAAKITEAYFKLPSTTDYNGIYRGKYIDFEAKDNMTTTSFPLKSIHSHQISHLEAVIRHGGIAFVIVRFVQRGETFFVPAKRMTNFYRTANRSSIPYDWFRLNGTLIPSSYTKPVDYLQIVDRLYFKD